MSKHDPVERWEYQPFVPYSEASPLHGSAIAPMSIPPNRLRVDELSALSADLGYCTGGTFSVGTLGKSRVVIGDDVNGLACTDATGAVVLRFDHTSGALTLGIDESGQKMLRTEGTRLLIHGDAMIQGTLQANRIILGPLARVMLDSDEIRVGSGTPGTDYSGFRITAETIGGYSFDSETWTVDSGNGLIMTKSTALPEAIYASFGATGVVFSNIAEFVDDMAAIRFLSRTPDDVTIYDELRMYSDGATLYVQNPDTRGIGLGLRDSNGHTPVWMGADDTGASFTLQVYSTPTYHLSLRAGSLPGISTIGTALSLSCGGIGDTRELRLISDAGAVLSRTNLVFRPNWAGEWAQRPDAPAANEMIVRVDPINKRIEFWDTTAWYAVDMTAI